MSPQTVITHATTFALVVLSLALLLTVIRIVRGPTLPDRVLALDMLVAVAIGMIAAIAIRTGFELYIDIAIALGLVGFLATVAFARFILSQAKSSGSKPVMPPAAPSRKHKATRRKGGKR